VELSPGRVLALEDAETLFLSWLVTGVVTARPEGTPLLAPSSALTLLP